MRRIRKYVTLSSILIGIMLFFCGCTPNRPYDKDKIENYLENRYKTNFSFVLEDEVSEYDLEHCSLRVYDVYTFTSEDGITCEVYGCCEVAIGFPQYVCDNYREQWLLAHPEISGDITESKKGRKSIRIILIPFVFAFFSFFF